MSIQKSILQNNIFKFLFFDQYLGPDGEGGDPLETLNHFSDYIRKFFNICEEKNECKINPELTFLINKFTTEDYFNSLNDILSDTIINKLLADPYIILISGWTANPVGHAIMIYIKKNINSTYDVYLINTGDGLEYQKNNIIIKYENIDKEKILKLIYFNKFIMDSELNERILYINRNILLSDNLKYDNSRGYFIKKLLYKNDINNIDKNVYYKHIINILGDIFIPITDYTNITWQLSSSCSFYSVYYFIVLLFNDYIVFNNFDTYLKTILINEYLLLDIYDMMEKDLQIYMNTSMCLIRDNTILLEKRNTIKYNMVKINNDINLSNIKNNYTKYIKDTTKVKNWIDEALSDLEKYIININILKSYTDKLDKLDQQIDNMSFVEKIIIRNIIYSFINNLQFNIEKIPKPILKDKQLDFIKKILNSLYKLKDGFLFFHFLEKIFSILNAYTWKYENPNPTSRYINIESNGRYIQNREMENESIMKNSHKKKLKYLIKKLEYLNVFDTIFSFNFNIVDISNNIYLYRNILFKEGNDKEYYFINNSELYIDYDSEINMYEIIKPMNIKIDIINFESEILKLDTIVNIINTGNTNLIDIQDINMITILNKKINMTEYRYNYNNDKNCYIENTKDNKNMLLYPSTTCNKFIDIIKPIIDKIDIDKFITMISSLSENIICNIVILYILVTDSPYNIKLIESVKKLNYDCKKFLVSDFINYMLLESHKDNSFLNYNLCYYIYIKQNKDHIKDNIKDTIKDIRDKILQINQEIVANNSTKSFTYLDISNNNNITNSFNREIGIIDLKLNNIIIQKLNYMKINYSTWKYDKIILIELIDFNCKIIIYDTNTIILMDNNNNNYKLIIKSTLDLINMWMLFLNNGFLLQKIDSPYEYFVIILMSNNIIDTNIIQNNYWDMITTNRYNFKLIENKYHIIKFHFTNLTFMFNNINDFFALFISLYLARNTMCMILLKNRYNHYIKKTYDCSVYSEYIKYLLDNYMDIPFSYFFNNMETNYELRSKFYNIKPIIFKYDTIESIDIKELRVVKKLSEKITTLSIKYTIDNKIIEEKIHDFISKFRSRCNSYDIVSSPLIDNTEFNNTEFDNTEKDIYLKIIHFDEDYTVSLINNIYLFFCKYFYTKLIKIKFVKISNELLNIKKKDMLVDCGFVLSILQSLDPYHIYSFDKKREIEDILFEIHSEMFIRADQKTFLDKIYKDKNSNITSYELLMGSGKTSVITPILILRELVKSDPILNFNIVLPEHLVNSSYDIMLKYIDLFNDMMILKNNYNKDDNIINIMSDTVIKETYLKHIIVIDYKKISDIINSNNFFIFDEIDTLINPYTSDLNMQDTKSFYSQDNIDIIKKIILVIAKEIHNMNNMNNIQITNGTNSINISSGEKNIYSNTDIKDIKFIPVIIAKLNKIINQNKLLQYNVNYGFRNDIDDIDDIDDISKISKIKNFFIAIPYNANNSPVNGSEFTDFILSLLLTTLSFYKNKLRKKDVILLFNIIRKMCTSIELFKIFYSNMILIINDATITDNLYNNINTNKYSNDFCEIINKINNDEQIEIINLYLTEIIFKNFFNILISQYNISLVDILNINICKKKITFSGTVNFNLPAKIMREMNITGTSITGTSITDMINSTLSYIEKNSNTAGSILSAILGITHVVKPEIKTYIFNIQENEKNLLTYLSSIINDNTNLKYNALIDVAGLFVSPVLTIVKQLYDIIKTFRPDILIFYVDDKNIKRIYHNIDDTYNNNTNYDFSNVFIYYDNKNCIGTDFTQPFIFTGLVTISYKNTLTQIAQGIFRLRNINIGHKIDFYVDTKIDLTLDKNNSENYNLYLHLQSNNIKLQENSTSLTSIQCLKYIGRYLSNYNKKQYYENIYYETIKINSKYITYEDFINNMLQKIKDDNKINIDRIIIDNVNLVQTNININIDIDITINKLSLIEEIKIIPLDNIINFDDYIKNLMDNSIINFTFKNITNLISIPDNVNRKKYSQDKRSIKTLGKEDPDHPIKQYKIYLSKYLLYCVKLKYKTILNNLYFIQKKNTTDIIIITFYEYLLLNKSLYNVYNKYGIGRYDKNTFKYYIKYLLFHTKLELYDIIKTNIILYNESITNESTKIESKPINIISLLQLVLNYNYNINLDYFNNKTVLTLKLNDINFYKNILNYNNIMTPENDAEFQKIINTFITENKLDKDMTFNIFYQTENDKKEKLFNYKEREVDKMLQKYLKYKIKYHALKRTIHY